MPEWVSGAGLVLLAVFPITLAYVIVVQRAMNVRASIRAGVRYTPARDGLKVLRPGL